MYFIGLFPIFMNIFLWSPLPKLLSVHCNPTNRKKPGLIHYFNLKWFVLFHEDPFVCNDIFGAKHFITKQNEALLNQTEVLLSYLLCIMGLSLECMYALFYVSQGFIEGFPWFYVLWHHNLLNCCLFGTKTGVAMGKCHDLCPYVAVNMQIHFLAEEFIVWYHRVFLNISGNDFVYFKGIWKFFVNRQHLSYLW